jgi:hypothetical protein
VRKHWHSSLRRQAVAAGSVYATLGTQDAAKASQAGHVQLFAAQL